MISIIPLCSFFRHSCCAGTDAGPKIGRQRDGCRARMMMCYWFCFGRLSGNSPTPLSIRCGELKHIFQRVGPVHSAFVTALGPRLDGIAHCIDAILQTPRLHISTLLAPTTSSLARHMANAHRHSMQASNVGRGSRLAMARSVVLSACWAFSMVRHARNP